MSNIDLTVTMDAMAEALIGNVITRVYAWPAESVTAPCIVIAYPETIDLDYTMDDGSDSAKFPIYYIAGKVSDRNTRDELSKIISGVKSVKTALDGDLSGAVNSCSVQDCEITEITIGSIAFAAAKFTVEIIS
jgi:hypothetical protein